MMTDFRLQKCHRLRKSGDFDRVYAQRQRSSDRWILIYAAENGLPCSRFGLSVSRKLGNSVRRSRFKRLLREAWRLSQHELPSGFDFILIPRADVEPNLESYCKSLAGQAKRLARKIRR